MGEQRDSESDYKLDISVLAEMRSTTVSELFPSLAHCSSVLIHSPNIDRRAQTSLNRQGCRTWGDLQALYVGDLWEIPHAGKLTVERILAAAKNQAALIVGEQRDSESDYKLDISVLAEMRSTTVSELFPSLAHCSSVLIRSPNIDRRAQTSLNRQGCRTWGDLQALYVGDLWEIPHAGKLTVERILTAAKNQAALIAGGHLSLTSSNGGEVAAITVAPRSTEQVAVDRFIVMLVEWARDSRGAVSVEDLLVALEGPLPPDVASALEEMNGFFLDDVVPGMVNPADSSRLIIEFLDDLGSASGSVVARHIVNPSGGVPTLESIAQPAGVTSERIRQLVKQGLAAAQECRNRQSYRLLSWRAADLRSSLGTLCRADVGGVDEAIANSARGLADPDGCTAVEFMLWFAGEYRRDGEWWVSGEVGRVDTAKRMLRDALENEWLLERSRLFDRFAAAGVTAELNDADVAFLAGWRNIGDEWWIRWDGALGDKAQRILRLALRAVPASEMNELIGEGHSESSVRNVLSVDDRFMRVSMELDYALSEWEWEEYSTAAQEIEERIERAGGEVALDDVVIDLFNQFGLKEATVRTYAASPAFVVSDGIIRLRRADEEFVVDDRVSGARGLYLRPDGCVVFHLPVDADVLRGSGRSIPNPLSVAVGVHPGDVRDFSAGKLGRVRISWRAISLTGAAIGSTRSVVENLNAKSGDVVRLVFDLDAETVKGALVSGATLSDQTGLPLTPGSEAAELATAIRVDAREVRAALAERGDATVASMIPVASQSSGLDDALRRLATALLG